MNEQDFMKAAQCIWENSSKQLREKILSFRSVRVVYFSEFEINRLPRKHWEELSRQSKELVAKIILLKISI